jgi:hypothetical protein
MTRFERRLRIEAARQRNRLIRSVAEQVEKGIELPSYLFTNHERALKVILEQHYRRVIPFFGKLALSSVKSRRIERKAADSLFQHLVSEWIVREGLRKAKLIAATDRDDVIDALQEGVEAGEGTAAIASRIKKVSQLTAYRAATVARTETHAAATFGAAESARNAEQDLGIRLLKVWLPTMDDRTRDSHRAMQDHPPIPLDEKFSVGGVMMDRPGDPSAPAEETINCRCALAYEEAE